eukprot:363811-Chlamydomonas_euryale.AAC.13
MHADASWGTDMHADASWGTDMHADALWGTDMHADASWGTDMHADALWGTGMHADASLLLTGAGRVSDVHRECLQTGNHTLCAPLRAAHRMPAAPERMHASSSRTHACRELPNACVPSSERVCMPSGLPGTRPHTRRLTGAPAALCNRHTPGPILRQTTDRLSDWQGRRACALCVPTRLGAMCGLLERACRLRRYRLHLGRCCLHCPWLRHQSHTRCESMKVLQCFSIAVSTLHTMVT